MNSAFASIRLRPIRVALLVRPTDTASVRKYLRACSCLWGGAYNPIIPVFKRTPNIWREPHGNGLKPKTVTRGYVEFYEPDAFVEAEEGLLEEAGLAGYCTNDALETRAVSLKDFAPLQEKQAWPEPVLGLSIRDALQDIYDDEQRFQLRHQRPAVSVDAQKGSLLTEAVFGCYPRGRLVDRARQDFVDVFDAERHKATPETWRRVFLEGATTPLRFTAYKLEASRMWHHDVVLFVFDPSNPMDVIDLWNMRSEPRPLIPLPIGWWDDLADDVQHILKSEHRPVRGNPNGLMHGGTIEFARSIDSTNAEHLASRIADGLPKGSVSLKFWRTAIWKKHFDQDRVFRDKRIEVTAKEERFVDIPLPDNDTSQTRVPSLSPDFAEEYGKGGLRWTNVLDFSLNRRERFASILPFNTFDPTWPRLIPLSGRFLVGTEGWSFCHQYKERSNYIPLQSPDQAIIGWLEHHGIVARLSEPGHVAKQVLDHIGGLWGIHLLKDAETLEMLNTMAGGIRRTGKGENETEVLFDRRSKTLKQWHDHIEVRKKRRSLPYVSLNQLTDAQMIRLGLKSVCTHCHAVNWHNLKSIDYELKCERCQKHYIFPQSKLEKNNGNWAFRTVGPFAVPDYARGSYGALLALDVLDGVGRSNGGICFSTALSMQFDGVDVEADYVGWWASEGPERKAPKLVIGEAKSFGKGELIKPSDLSKLRQIGDKIPDAVFVISVMRDYFTEKEKVLLRKFAQWGRRRNEYGQPKHHIVLLTGQELFFDLSIGTTWKKLGEPHSRFEDWRHTQSLNAMAEATQSIYLGLPSYFEGSRASWEKRTKSRPADRSGRVQ